MSERVVNYSGGSPLVYFARAIDDEDPEATLRLSDEIRAELLRHSLVMIDPFVHERKLGAPEQGVARDADFLVRLDLMLLRKADAILVDMTIPNRNYVGCVCEITYAYLWGIPAVVYVGDTGNDRRHWLKFHSSVVCPGRAEAIEHLSQILATSPLRFPIGDD
jgi:nucleoside 2-deoxyribosyltransferase